MEKCTILLLAYSHIGTTRTITPMFGEQVSVSQLLQPSGQKYQEALMGLLKNSSSDSAVLERSQDINVGSSE